MGGHGNAAYGLDVAARHRLAIGQDGERFQHGAGIARRFFRRQAIDISLHFRFRLKPPAARHLRELDVVAVPVTANLVQQPTHEIGLERRVEQLAQLREGQRLARCQQRGFENVLDLFQFVHVTLSESENFESEA